MFKIKIDEIYRPGEVLDVRDNSVSVGPIKIKIIYK